MKKVIPTNQQAFPQPQTLLGVLQDMNLDSQKIKQVKSIISKANENVYTFQPKNSETIFSSSQHDLKDNKCLNYHRLFYVVSNARPSIKVTMTSNIDQLSINRTEKGDRMIMLNGGFVFKFKQLEKDAFISVKLVAIAEANEELAKVNEPLISELI